MPLMFPEEKIEDFLGRKVFVATEVRVCRASRVADGGAFCFVFAELIVV